MPKLICVKCEVELRPETNGVLVKEMFLDPPEPYKLWFSDLWKCPKCGIEICAGFGSAPIAEHYQENFNEFLEHVETTAPRVILDKEK